MSMVKVSYSSSKNPPTIVIELSISEATLLIQKHENMTNVVHANINKALKFAAAQPNEI